MTRVKICGITETEHARAAVDAGADFIGLVFAPSKRLIDVEKAKEITTALKRRTERGDSKAMTVGVFVNTPAAEVNRIADYCGLDTVQLSGDEHWDYLIDIEKPIIKAIRVHPQHVGKDLLAELASGCQLLGADLICLLDCYVAGSYGGSGQAFEWIVAREVSEKFPVIIAGGLSPKNVGQAIKLARPWGVDVSSGVESDGVKDISKINAFIAAVRRTDKELGEKVA
jgi:phosphoribosylanthranilate isomerase